MASEQDGAFKPTAAAKRMRVSVRAVRGLLDHGILEPRMVKERQTARIRRYVSCRSAERFAAEYVTVVDLAVESGRMPGAEAVLQVARGVRPLQLGARCNLIFRRSAVM